MGKVAHRCNNSNHLSLSNFSIFNWSNSVLLPLPLVPLHPSFLLQREHMFLSITVGIRYLLPGVADICKSDTVGCYLFYSHSKTFFSSYEQQFPSSCCKTAHHYYFLHHWSQHHSVIFHSHRVNLNRMIKISSNLSFCKVMVVRR